MDRSLPLDCIFLAAGSSSRMGRPKLLLPFHGTTVLGASVAAALGAGLRAIIVSRPDDAALLEEFSGRDGVELAVNPHPERGMMSSFQAGVAAVRSERFFFQPADMPFIPPEIYAWLASLPATGPVIPTAGGRKGHPVLMPASMIPGILGAPPGIPLNALVLSSGPVYAETAERGILRDIDTRMDYAEAVAGDLPGSSVVGPLKEPSCSPRVGG